MKKYVVFSLLILIGVYVARTMFTKQSLQPLPVQKPRPTVVQTQIFQPVKQERILFVPYWTLTSWDNQSDYDSFIYFGIAPNEIGINTSDPGFADIPRYIDHISPSKTLLGVRMTDKIFNEKVLNSATLQQQIISDALHISKQDGFKGILLDFEVGGIGFDSLTQQVTGFITEFAQAAKRQESQFSVAMYGDVYYRARPYNIKTIAENSDKIIVMAYDFHKAAGDPGPNFPFEESAVDGYSFQQMISDFSQDVPKNKLTITFGMFGYDWPVTEKGASIDTATSMSLSDIQSSFITTCKFSSCVLRRNVSGEPSISYTDTDRQKHIVWFEDTMSTDKKIHYLQTKGIGSIAFWANSYF